MKLRALLAALSLAAALSGLAPLDAAAVVSHPIPNKVGVVAAGRNIAARTDATTPNSKLNVTADELVIKDASKNELLVSSVSVTVDITASGANGLDTGAEGSSTWYYVWVIGKADRTVAGLLSTSTSAPTMPAGYTFKALVSAVRNDGSSNFIKFRQFGNRVYYEARQAVLSGGSSVSEATVSVSAAVPAIATSMLLSMRLDATNTGAGGGTDTFTVRYISGSDWHACQQYYIGGSSVNDSATTEMPNVGQQFFYIIGVGAGAPTGNAWVQGFRLPLGGQ